LPLVSKFYMTLSKVVLCLCLSFVFGILLESFFVLPSEKLTRVFILLCFLVLFFVLLKKKQIAFFSLILICVVLGILRFHAAELKISHSRLRNYNDLGKEIVLIGTVSKEPEIRKNQTKIEVSVQEIIIENQKIPVSGKVLVIANPFPQYNYANKLKIKGTLQTPQNSENFNWRGYLAKEGICSVSYWPQIELIKTDDNNDFFSKIYGGILYFKNKLRQSIHYSLLPPQSWIAGAMILGDKTSISSEFKEKLNITGLRHITAISGMHITILSVVLMQLLIGIGLWRSQAFYLTIFLLVLFIVMIGMPSSALRAGIMSGFLLFSEKIGRKSYAQRAVVFAATFILVANPLLLRFDVGFQLSFLAIMGIIYLSPIFEKCLRIIPKERFLNLRSILAMTLSAQIFTLPILIYNFGQVSLVAPITNILILPFIPFIIGSGFLFALIGIISPLLGLVFSWPCWLILTYVVKVIDCFSQLPISSITFKDISWAWLGVYYLFLFLALIIYQERIKNYFLKY